MANIARQPLDQDRDLDGDCRGSDHRVDDVRVPSRGYGNYRARGYG